MKKGFSLIELLVVLIVLSLLLSAFIPLVTKKLKASEVTVGSFSSSTNDNDITSQKDCDKISNDLLFIPKSETGTKNLCVMKYNVGDGRYGENWSGVQKCFVGGNCEVENSSSTSVTKDNLTPTCWQGKTASSCNAAYKNYSGCNRTVCNWTGANKLCTNLGYRLPTIEELESFTSATYSNNTLNENGLMFCDYTNNSTTASICTALPNNCTNSYGNNCYPHDIWSSTPSGNSLACYRGLGTQWYATTGYIGYAFSARCVIDGMNATQEAIQEKDSCLTKYNNKCTSCASGYVLLNGKCLTCEPSNGFVKVNNLCVMQYNIGDGRYRESWNGVQKCIAGNTCTVQNGSSTSATKDNLTPTCWQGKTASTCNSNFGGYDGCTRTICNWTGANQMCTNIGWRLPTFAELQSFASTTYSNNILAENGLMFCNHDGSSLAPQCATLANSCTNTFNNYCNTYALWSSTFSTNYIAYGKNLNIQWYDGTGYLGHAFSTRCVKDL